MVSPRRTCLLRAPDLAGFQQAIAVGGLGGDARLARDTAILVPTTAAAGELRQTLEELVLIAGWRPGPADLAAAGVDAWTGGDTLVLPHLVTRAGLYQLLESRLTDVPPVLHRLEREVLFERAAACAGAAGAAPPFELRPALLAEMQTFYDALGRHVRSIDDFERLVGTPLEAGAVIDRGARRLLEQTRFLAATFREYERVLASSDAFDEHLLRRRLLEQPAVSPLRRVVISVADQAASPSGLFRADYDLLTRLPGLESIVVVATEATLASGYLARLLDTLPEIEVRSMAPEPRPLPVLEVPADDRLYFVSRDREEELADFAERLREHAQAGASDAADSDAAAFVYQRPLPYLALAHQVLDAHRTTWQAVDAQPLAAEPYAAAIDLVLTFVSTEYARSPGLALLRAPYFRIGAAGDALTRETLAAADRELRDAYFLGGRHRLQELRDRWRTELEAHDQAMRPAAEQAPRGGAEHRAAAARQRRRTALQVVDAMLWAADRLDACLVDAPAVEHLRALEAFLHATGRPPAAGPAEERWLRARSAIVALLQGLASAFARFGDAPRPFTDVAALLRRLIEEHTFSPRVGPGTVHLVDADAAPYGRFGHVTLAGVVEGEWPAAGAHQIFYPLGLLRDLGWPSEADRRVAARMAFDDLLRLASRSVAVSTFSLDDEAIVRPAPLVEDLERVGLATDRGTRQPATAPQRGRPLALTVLVLEGVEQGSAWRALRSTRSAADNRFKGYAGELPARPYAVTGVDRYLQCPFKYFAAQVLRLEEEADDRPGLTVQERGQLVHEVFREFFSRWDRAGLGTVDVSRIAEARALFVAVVDERLQLLPESERSLERTRLIGSIAGAGLGERTFRFEAARPTPVVERLLELALDGTYRLASGEVRLRGTADRIDLLADGTLRILDYKTGKASSAREALQIPVYAYCAEQRLAGHQRRVWTVGEAGYLAFGRTEPYVSIVTAENRGEMLTRAVDQLADTTARIERGDFPVAPVEPHLCMYCGFSSVCRKDYVEEE